LGNFYHIFSRGNNRESLFAEERNYDLFLRLWAKHTSQVAETHAYCLLGNHFHFFVQIKDEKDVAAKWIGSLSKPFSNLFNAYARTFNETYHRSGALFTRPFHRLKVESDAYRLSLIAYIHQNPQKHGFVDDFRDWPYSSYRTLLSSQPTRLKRDEVIALFSGREQFVEFHKRRVIDVVEEVE